jgi:hypothetical protein
MAGLLFVARLEEKARTSAFKKARARHLRRELWRCSSRNKEQTPKGLRKG